MSDDRRTVEGAPLRADIARILAGLNEPDEAKRLVLPEGTKLQVRIFGEYEDGRVDTGIGVAKVWKNGVEFEWNTAVVIEPGRKLRASTAIVLRL